MISDKEKYINLSTQKKDSTSVNTPVWFAQDEDKNSFYVFSNGRACFIDQKVVQHCCMIV